MSAPVHHGNPRRETLLWLVQRASAVVLAVTVTVHLATIIYAVQEGLSAAAILARVRGNGAWLAFYALFVLAVAVHAPIGLRTIARETTPLRGRALDLLMALLSLILLGAGLHAAFALYGAPAP